MSPLIPRVLLSGRAKLPQDTAIHASYDLLALIVVVEKEHGVILEVDATSLSAPARDFVKDALVGVSLDDSLEPVLQYLNDAYRGGAKKTIVAALTDIYKQWQRLREEQPHA